MQGQVKVIGKVFFGSIKALKSGGSKTKSFTT